MPLPKLRVETFLSPWSSPASSPGPPKMIPVPSSILRPTCLKTFAGTIVFILILQVASFARPSFPQTEHLRSISNSLSAPFPRPPPASFPQFNSYGSTQCLPSISPERLKKTVEKHATCTKYSPFHVPRTRIATLTAAFGGLEGNEHYTRALTTHFEHALVHGTEVHVLCDKMIDDLWNKPAFILDLLLREMIKPEKERLEWLVWVDRDTLILDQCRPASTFLPSSTSSPALARWWRRDEQQSNKQQSSNPTKPPPEVNFLAANDMNGLNNGIFFVRVSHWAIEVFTAILAYRHYNPAVELRWTEQSAMELVLQDHRFSDKVQLVPQHWFNAYQHGNASDFVSSNGTNPEGWDELNARRGDWLIHFAGNQHKDKELNEWADILEGMEDVWETGRVQRNVGGEVRQFWEERGFIR
jgi:mannan polymerase II complex MNN10 subunit